MSKLKVASIVSKIALNSALATVAAYKMCKRTGSRAINAIKCKQKYDIDIYKGDEQIEFKQNLSKQQMLDIVKTMEVFPDISIIIKVHNYKGYTILDV